MFIVTEYAALISTSSPIKDDISSSASYRIGLKHHHIWIFQSKNEGKDQESIQSSTTPDPGYQWESNKLTIRHHNTHPQVFFVNLQFTRPRGYKTFSYSTQLSTKFKLLNKTKIPKNKEFSCFKSPPCCIYHANKMLNVNNCWHFTIYEHDKFRAQLS